MSSLLGSLLEDNSLKQQGFWNASTNTPTLANSVGVQGYYYVVSVGGTVNFGAGNITFTVGDWVYYNTANQWVKFETGVAYTPEDVANKATTFGTINDTLYPSVKAVNDQLTTKVNKAGDTMTGTLNFSGNGLKVTGDFSNATRANRLALQTSTVNGNTRVPLLPNGTSRLAGIDCHDGVDADNSSFLQVHSDGTNNHAGLNSAKVGTGTTKDLVLQIDSVTRAKLNAANGGFQYLQPVNAQTGTTYTVVADDFAKLITINNASPVTITLPQQSTTPTSTGFHGEVLNLGLGRITYVKEGAETLDGNTTQDQYARIKFSRPTTTKWAVAYGTALKPSQIEATRVPSVPVAGTTYVIVTKPKDPFTVTGFVQQATSLGTAGTYTVFNNGVAIPGLTAVANTTTINETAATALSVSAGDQITIVLTGIVSPVGWVGSLSILQTF